MEAGRGDASDIVTADCVHGSSGTAEYSPHLGLTVIADATPLDAQVGADQKLTYPVQLHDLLFGNLSSLDRTGQTALLTYAVLDAAKIMDLPDRLADSGLEHRCLFTGQATADLGAVAPWLVQLEPAHALTRQLFTIGMAPWQF